MAASLVCNSGQQLNPMVHGTGTAYRRPVIIRPDPVSTQNSPALVRFLLVNAKDSASLQRWGKAGILECVRRLEKSDRSPSSHRALLHLIGGVDQQGARTEERDRDESSIACCRRTKQRGSDKPDYWLGTNNEATRVVGVLLGDS